MEWFITTWLLTNNPPPEKHAPAFVSFVILPVQCQAKHRGGHWPPRTGVDVHRRLSRNRTDVAYTCRKARSFTSGRIWHPMHTPNRHDGLPSLIGAQSCVPRQTVSPTDLAVVVVLRLNGDRDVDNAYMHRRQ